MVPEGYYFTDGNVDLRAVSYLPMPLFQSEECHKVQKSQNPNQISCSLFWLYYESVSVEIF